MTTEIKIDCDTCGDLILCLRTIINRVKALSDNDPDFEVRDVEEFDDADSYGTYTVMIIES